jgi:glutathione peroxidase
MMKSFSYSCREMLVALILSTIFLGIAMPAQAEDKGSIYHFTLKSIEGKDILLKKYEGKVLLIVNVASECGYTPQYKDLEALYKKYKSKGFVVLGFPSNNFGKQESGTDAEIRAFCERNYGVTFDMFSKISVKGTDQHPLYKMITSDKNVAGDVKWNFQKYLVDRKGNLKQKFMSDVEPMSKELVAAIEDALK